MKRTFTLSLLLAASLQSALLWADNWYVNLARKTMPTYALTGQPFSAEFTLTNEGSNAVNSVTMQYTPTGGTAVTSTHYFETPLAAGESADVTFDGFTCDVEGESVQGYFSIPLVNGENNYGNYTYCYLFSGDRFVARNVVAEAATSPDCGYCPRGIVAMEYMNAKHTDGTWIPIEVEKNGGMSTTAYADFWKRVGSSTPRTYLNRDYVSSISPTKVGLDEYYDYYRARPTVVEVGATSTVAGTTATVDASANFVLDFSDANLGFAYTLTEDGITGYYQLNYYSGETADDLDGWGERSYYANWTYNNVAREGSIFHGISGSLPAALVKGQDYSYQQELDLSGINDISKAYVTVMVVDCDNYEVKNAVRIPLNGGTTAVNAATAAPLKVSATTGGIAVSPAADVTVTTTDGRRVAQASAARFVAVPAGLYVVSAGGSHSKVLVK